MRKPASLSPTHRAPAGILLGVALAALGASCSGDLAAPSGPGVVGELPSGEAPPGGVADTPGRTGPRRLTNLEYDYTVRDLLGTQLALARNFVAEEAAGFDNVASALGMTPSQYESYFNAAEALGADTMGDATRRAALVPCALGSAANDSCLAQSLQAFTTRAFRRPPTPTEIEGLTQAYARAIGLGETREGAFEHVLVSVLASPQFLYRFELDATPDASAVDRALDGYELASRLSYFLWSTMPDAELFGAAADGSLVETEVLSVQLARMLDDARANTLIDNFAAQWLGLRALEQHKVLAERYPNWSEDLRRSMLEEARAFFAEFLVMDRPLTEFLSTPLHFVDARLAAHYALDAAPAAGSLLRIEQPIGERRGFLGLAAFLTVSSFAHRTSPTLRAKWVLEELLCNPVPPPPPNLVIADLDGDEAANAAAAIENVRERLELHRSDPQCAGCHASMDPIGLGLESFDAVGASRTHYENGDPVDTRGELPNGAAFSGLGELSTLLADDPRFLRCVAQKTLTYALGRAVERERALVDATHARLQQQPTLRALIEGIVLSDAFRKRGVAQ